VCLLIVTPAACLWIKARPKNDPSTPQAWLPNRTEPFSITHHTMIAISDLARFSTLRR
jgi:hypothetical protein